MSYPTDRARAEAAERALVRERLDRRLERKGIAPEYRDVRLSALLNERVRVTMLGDVEIEQGGAWAEANDAALDRLADECDRTVPPQWRVQPATEEKAADATPSIAQRLGMQATSAGAAKSDELAKRLHNLALR